MKLVQFFKRLSCCSYILTVSTASVEGMQVKRATGSKDTLVSSGSSAGFWTLLVKAVEFVM